MHFYVVYTYVLFINFNFYLFGCLLLIFSNLSAIGFIIGAANISFHILAIIRQTLKWTSYYIKMLEEIQQGRNKFTVKIYISLILFLTLIIVPLQELKRIFEYYTDFNTYTETLARGPLQQYSEIQLTSLYPLLSRNPYKGTWESSIKRSEFLEQESGRIELRTTFNQSDQFNNYNLKISIFDGWYADDKRYDITINTGSIKVKQRYQAGKVLYETVSPLLSYYHWAEGFKIHSQKSLYINKLKLKVFAMFDALNSTVESLKLEVLISSEYSINVIGRQIYEYQETLHDGLLSTLIMVQLLVQGYGIYLISESLISRKQTAERYSTTGFLLSIANDFTEAIALTFVGFLSRKKVAVFCLPILTSWIIIVIIELRVLTMIFHEQFRVNSLKLATKFYGLFSLICFLSYMSNFHWIYFIVFSITAMFPQIYNNYMVGHNLKQSMKYFFMYILPRYLLIPYVRLYEYNVFGFQPNFTLCIVCFLILALQVTLIVLQVKFGVRSIVPKFLHPEELKYFLSETDSEDDICSICLTSIKQKAIVDQVESNELKQMVGEQIQNNIVLTPCRHKFHIECLAQSMTTKSECPNCRSVLPPLQQYS